MFTAALTAAVLLTAVAGFLVYVCRILAATPSDQVHADANRNMDELRCPLCYRVRVRGTDHGYGRCATSPAPPPPPVRRQLIEATYRKAGR